MSANVLISLVDDDEAAREAVAGLVRSFGFDIAAFENAADFLKSNDRSRTACLIADVRMSGMSGTELHRHLAASGTPIPTVLITAYPDGADCTRALEDGVRCYLAKPLQPGELLACIRSAVHRGEEGFD